MFGIDDAIAAGANLVDDIVKRIWPDANEEQKMKFEQFKTELDAVWRNQLAQLDINKLEAQSTSLFVSGWRPAIGWVCGVALTYAAVIEPLVRFVAVVGFGYVGAFPVLDTDITLQILLALLGLGGYRSIEKIKGVARK